MFGKFWLIVFDLVYVYFGGGGIYKWGIYSFWKYLGSVFRSLEMIGLEREVMGEEGGEK